MSERQLGAMLAAAIIGAAEGKSNRLGNKTLEQLMALTNEPRDYHVGDVVVWKCPQLKTLRSPSEGENMRVARTLDKPVFDDKEGCGIPFFAMPLDVVIACLDTDGEYLEFLVDGRRIRRAG